MRVAIRNNTSWRTFHEMLFSISISLPLYLGKLAAFNLRLLTAIRRFSSGNWPAYAWCHACRYVDSKLGASQRGGRAMTPDADALSAAQGDENSVYSVGATYIRLIPNPAWYSAAR